MEYPFDEEAYLARYPDIAAAVKSGTIKSGLEHFEQAGRAEGRTGVSCETAAALGRQWGKNLCSMSPPVAGGGNASAGRLERYFDAHRTGAGIWKWRHYFPIYERHFSKFRGTDFHFLEIGIYSGGSLCMWRDYFGPAAHIYGVDIQPDCKVYETDRTKIFIGDQSDPSFWEEFRSRVPTLDVVVDDGGHTFHQQAISFEQLLPHLRSGGVYLCEDVAGEDNPFAAFIAGMAPLLNPNANKATINADDPTRSLTFETTTFQRIINSISLYPLVTVIELNSVQPFEFCAPKHGSVWQPFVP